MNKRTLVIPMLIAASAFGALVSVSAPAVASTQATVLPPAPDVDLNRSMLRDVKQFTRLVQQVRYFYPGDAVAATDWDKFVAETVVAMGQVKPHQRRQLGLTRLREIAPHISDRRSALEQFASTDEVAFWLQNGARLAPRFLRFLQLGSYGEIVPSPYFPDRNVARVNYAGQPLFIPLFLSTQASQEGTPYNDYRHWQVGSDFASVPVCVSTVSGMWGEIKYFWPYFDQVDVNWNRSLKKLLKACRESQPLARIKLIQTEFTKLQDNHVQITYPDGYGPQNAFLYPFLIKQVEGKPIVTSVTAEVEDQLAIGDELLTLNDVPFSDLLEAHMKWSLDSEQFSPFQSTVMLNFSDSQQPFTAVFKQADGNLVEVEGETVPRFSRVATKDHRVVPRTTEIVTELDDGLYKLNLYNLTMDSLTAVRAQLAQAQGVVVDLRHYPRDFAAWHVGVSWFLKQPATNDDMYRYFRKGPKKQDVYIEQLVRTIEVSPERLDVPVVVLSSRTSISANEHALNYIQDAGIPIIGVPTVGINGELMEGRYFADKPGEGVVFGYTGMRADNADGTQLIGRGVQPDILVPRTIESVRADVDNQLAAAIEYLKAQ
ncbi:S41 family peptidase [Pseudoalteromonas sp. DL2-H2.2]|uniref:S41 family peptidase n=1 Tax=Pseudoalteromonas sp. DL2-H2.2 TaxID=2908889 RepID=UPI001F3012BB|nr:S41 family peptidase [Pseudoalteromonas sp. DL2-H2.2]MCF2907069.1 S41 family peptidase [Pseudoalteromonas sp. DL2-H2.2]